MPLLTKYAAIVAIGASIFVDGRACPPLGAVLPAPKSPSRSEAVETAVSKLKEGLDAETSSFKSSALSIAVKSIHEDGYLFNYHFTPPNAGSGASSVDDHTIYRIASGTKLFTVLASLQSKSINMEDSVLKYLPDLGKSTSDNDNTSIQWEDVTVASLAGHLSGLVAQDLGVFGSGMWEGTGLPGFSPETGPSCSGLPGTVACTADDFRNLVNRHPPIYSPYSKPVYSNIGLALLGLVVEAANGEHFNETIQRDIFDVVGMNHTSLGKLPAQKDVFIPHGDTIWNATLGVFDPAGGIYSTVADMIAFAEGILNHDFLTPVQTRKWLKTVSATASWGNLVGHPWEILRTDGLTIDGHIVDVYTKSGDLGLYHSLTVLIPDYDIAISLMMAGVEVSSKSFIVEGVLSTVIQSLLPAIETAGREEAGQLYVGEYIDVATNSSISVIIDDGPGLIIASWAIRGYDVLANIPNYSFRALASGNAFEKVFMEVRVYPALLQYGKGAAWRAVFDLPTPEDYTRLRTMPLFKDASCLSWLQQDRKVYNFLSLDEFIFYHNDDGDATAVKSSAFNVTMTKVIQLEKVEEMPANAIERTHHVLFLLAAVLVVLWVWFNPFRPDHRSHRSLEQVSGVYQAQLKLQ
ncbi:hypothetical protein G7046_g2511 [Stylonectria norvegica]|nr:hypothetical protein G7046_g2511 [Stylonectria norvegica]